jgi:universal stress protein A
MKEFREILVPIDFSEMSEKAIDPAYSLAKLIGGKVYLLHVIDLMPRPNPMYAHYAPRESVLKQEIDKIEIEARTKLLSLVPKDEAFKGLDTEILVVRHTSAPEAIVEQAAAVGADVIVLTHKGWSTLAHLLLGSTAEQVIRRAGCPVMVMRG